MSRTRLRRRSWSRLVSRQRGGKQSHPRRAGDQPIRERRGDLFEAPSQHRTLNLSYTPAALHSTVHCCALCQRRRREPVLQWAPPCQFAAVFKTKKTLRFICTLEIGFTRFSFCLVLGFFSPSFFSLSLYIPALSRSFFAFLVFWFFGGVFFFFLFSLLALLAIDHVAGQQRRRHATTNTDKVSPSDAFLPLVCAGAVVLPRTHLSRLAFSRRMAQLPPEVEGVAVAILIYSFLCLFCNFLMLWLLWMTRQTFSRTSTPSTPCLCDGGLRAGTPPNWHSHEIDTNQQAWETDIGVICMFTAISIVVNITQQIHDNLYVAALPGAVSRRLLPANRRADSGSILCGRGSTTSKTISGIRGSAPATATWAWTLFCGPSVRDASPTPAARHLVEPC